MTELPRSLPEFEAELPDDAACARWLLEKRWPDGFRCPACGHDRGWELGRERLTVQCAACERQVSVTAGTRPEPVADSRAKRNRLSEADLHVLAKLLEQRLERGEEAEALPRRQVVAEDDLLQLGVAHGVEVEVPRQVAA